MTIMDVIYLDNNATTQPAEEVVRAMEPFVREWYGNPSSVHRFAQRSRHAIAEARAQVAALVGSAEGELTFTSGGTESINTALCGLLAARTPRKRIITSAVEHSASRELCRQLARQGVEVVEIGVDAVGMLDLGALSGALDDRVALASFMWANNETGVIFPVAQVARMCREIGVPFHCDATQAVGKLPVTVPQAGMDVMSFAAHKFHGPKGIGALYIRRGLRIAPLLIGGPQEGGRRGGTENVAGIVGMGAAAQLAGKCLPLMNQVASLRDRLEEGILQCIESTAVHGNAAARLPNTTNIGFRSLEAEAILLLLSERGICASAGSACSSGSLEPSHVLRAMKVDEPSAHGAIRFSLSRYTTSAEVERTLQVLPGVIGKLREVMGTEQ